MIARRQEKQRHPGKKSPPARKCLQLRTPRFVGSECRRMMHRDLMEGSHLGWDVALQKWSHFQSHSQLIACCILVSLVWKETYGSTECQSIAPPQVTAHNIPRACMNGYLPFKHHYSPPQPSPQFQLVLSTKIFANFSSDRLV
jgi:hypothetical protein